MSANVETMFYVRENPWHGLGTKVNEAPGSREALIIAGLNWNVLQEPIYTETEEFIEGYKANVRDSDRKVLGVVTDRYKVIQNQEAFAFTDALLGEGVRYETAGSLQGGKRVWLLAHMPHEYIISGERISPYLVFTNTHDGSGAIKAALTPYQGGMPEYLEPGIVHRQAFLVHDSYWEYQREAAGSQEYPDSGRNLYGQPWQGV